MKNHVLLEYMFLIDPDGTFATLDQFEKSLADFFAAHGLEAEAVHTINTVNGRRMFIIKKIETLEALTPKPSFFKKEEKAKSFNELRNEVRKEK